MGWTPPAEQPSLLSDPLPAPVRRIMILLIPSISPWPRNQFVWGERGRSRSPRSFSEACSRANREPAAFRSMASRPASPSSFHPNRPRMKCRRPGQFRYPARGRAAGLGRQPGAPLTSTWISRRPRQLIDARLPNPAYGTWRDRSPCLGSPHNADHCHGRETRFEPQHGLPLILFRPPRSLTCHNINKEATAQARSWQASYRCSWLGRTEPKRGRLVVECRSAPNARTGACVYQAALALSQTPRQRLVS